MAIEKLSVVLELISGSYKKEAKEAADAIGRVGNAAKSVTGSLSTLVGPVAIGAAVIGLGRMALAAGESVDRLFDLRAQTGLSTDVLQEWEFVAKTAGTSQAVFSESEAPVSIKDRINSSSSQRGSRTLQWFSAQIVGAVGTVIHRSRKEWEK